VITHNFVSPANFCSDCCESDATQRMILPFIFFRRLPTLLPHKSVDKQSYQSSNPHVSIGNIDLGPLNIVRKSAVSKRKIDTQHAEFQKKNHVAETSSTIDSAAVAVWTSSGDTRWSKEAFSTVIFCRKVVSLYRAFFSWLAINSI
jgi:hypothetical protein